MHKLLIITASTLLLSACATNYGNVVPQAGGIYQITSIGDTKQETTGKALKGAEQKCSQLKKQFIVTKTEEKYIGKFASEQAHNQAKTARDAAKTIGLVSPTASQAAKVTDSYFQNAFQTKLTFKCE